MTNQLIQTPPPTPLTGVPKNFYHISFFHHGQPFGREIDPVFGQLSDDWLRYAANCWVIYTPYNAVTIFNTLKPYLKGDDQMMILEIKKDQIVQGWLPPWIWQWIYKQRS